MKYTILAASLFGMAAAHAATIAWSSAAYTVSGNLGTQLDTGQFATTGTQILAENSGGGALTFDGIDFAAGSITMGSSYDEFHEPNSFNGIPYANTRLARDGSYGSNGVAGTVNLTGLTSGHTYRIQALVFDGRTAFEVPGRTVRFDGINQGVYANGVAGTTWGNGLLVTGTFIADASTQNFSIEAFTSGGSSRGAQLNALTLFQTAVPEPSTALLGGLGILALLRRRR